MKNPYTQSAIALLNPCRSCGYERGLKIIRYEHDPGYIRCGFCDAPLFSVREVSDRKVEEVAS